MERFPIVDRVSYSSLVNFTYCGKYFELVNVKKLKTKGSPHMAFGTLVHRGIQETLNHEELIPKAVEKFNKIWNRFCKFYKLEQKYIDLATVAEKSIYFGNGFMKKNFGIKFKIKHVEYQILHKISEFPQNFKGFIDLVIELDNGKIIIADIKTTQSIYNFNKYKDNIKEYQLTLYKKFYSEIEGIDRDKIETCFIVIEKAPDSKKPLSLVEVSSGDKKIANAELWLSNSLRSINAEKYIKNKLSCKKYGENYPCIFYKSDNCS
jgi:hypothetical protein